MKMIEELIELKEEIEVDDYIAKDKCCLCGKVLPDEHLGRNNPRPLKGEGKCCDECNETKVIPARIDNIIHERRYKKK